MNPSESRHTCHSHRSHYRTTGNDQSCAFVLENGVAYHTHSSRARGPDGLWNMYQWLDRAPMGRNEERACGGAAMTSATSERDRQIVQSRPRVWSG